MLVPVFAGVGHAAQTDADFSVLRSDDRSLVIEYRPHYGRLLTVTGTGREFLLYDFDGSVSPRGPATTGAPDLRFRNFPLGFPAESGNEIRVIASDYEDIPNVAFAPVPKLRKNGDFIEIQGYVPDPELYATNAFLPGDAAQIGHIGKTRSMIIGSVHAYPLQYNPATRTLRKYSRLVIEVVYGASAGSRVQNQDDLLFRDVLLNYSVARNWKFGTQKALKKVGAPSVLATGTWYRIAVAEDGIYILNTQYLASVGINLSGVDPRTIKIFGNGGKEVPENVFLPRANDLVENAIYVEGEADGQFNTGDYILFYGKSVRGWEYDPAARFLRHYINHYGEVNYYWLTFDGTRGKRIQDQPSLSSTATVVQDRFQDAIAVEEEKRNVLRPGSGKNWYGQQLEAGGSFTYVNALPGLVPNDLIRYRYALIARSDTPPIFNVRENGVLIGRDGLGTIDLSGSGFTYATEGTFLTTSASSLPNNTSQLNFAFSSASSFSPEGWVDWIEIQYPRYFWADKNYLRFWSTDTSGVVEYRIEQFTGTPIILNVTRPDSVTRLVNVAGTYTFRAAEQKGRPSEYYAAAASAFKSPVSIQKTGNQDLHGYNPGADFIIITTSDFSSAADRLKGYREQPAHGNLRTVVVDVEQIYNEFGGGIPDITAIRDFLKYAYENWQPAPLYVLFFGAASYDYKSILGFRSSFVPTWQSPESLNDVWSYATDDYFVQFTGGGNVSMVSGRISCRDASEANIAVEKLIRYEDNSARDGWNVRMLFVGDDGWTSEVGDAEGWIHSEQAEGLAEGFTPDEFERRKIYIAEYPTVNTAQGRRKPGAYQAIIDQINQGMLVVNYAGHGNQSLWAHERIFEVLTSIPQLTNTNKLSLFFLATCNFSQFDNPNERSGGELLNNKPDGGAIAVVSASRKVYQPNNAELHRQVFRRLFGRDQFGRAYAIRPAEAIYLYKATVLNDVNNQKFFYLGDPSMRLQYPVGFASIDSINHQLLGGTDGVASSQPATLQALSRVTVNGRILNQNNQTDTAFSGRVLLTVNDASRRITIVNFAPGINWPYLAPGGTIYRGENSAVNGRFTATFVVPKDISYSDSTSRGRIEAYYSTSAGDGIGFTSNVRVGGTDSTAGNDTQGPTIALHLDSRSFRPGDMVSPEPTLYVDLRDPNGINTSVSGIGHRIEAWLNNSSQSKDVTEFYSSTLDNYQEGTVQYQMKDLPQGRNTIRVRAWDTFNNASSAETYFEVTSSDQLKVSDVMNYPNPFAGGTSFTFRQNQLAPLSVSIKVYTLAGRRIQSLESDSPGEPFVQIPWDGRDRDGDLLANGVYLYKVIVRTTDGRFSSEALGKLSVLR